MASDVRNLNCAGRRPHSCSLTAHGRGLYVSGTSRARRRRQPGGVRGAVARPGQARGAAVSHRNRC
eukprot:2582882-Alexandrium_andersonii.AAC.1